MKIWKRFGIFTLLGLLLSWLISCSSGSSPSAGKEIKFWTMQLDSHTSYFEQLIDKFKAQNPGVTVEWDDVAWAAMENQIITAVSAKTAPDVVNLNPTFASQLAAKQTWMDLDANVPAEVRGQYLPNIWKAGTLDGKSFGIPWYLTTNITIYNQDLLKTAGIAKPPATYAELAQAARQIKDKTGKYAFFATFVPQDSSEILESFVQMGVPLLDDRQQAAFNTREGKAVFQYWVDLYQQGLLPKEVLTQGHRRASELYQSGETAMLSSGPEFINVIDKNAPEIAKISGVAPLISGPTGKKNVAVMNLIVPRETKNPQEALKFALFVTNTENQLAFAKAANVLPSTLESVEAYKRQLAADPKGSLVTKGLNISASQLSQAEVLIPPMKNINALQKAIYGNLQAAMLKEKSVDQAIADAAQEWNEKVGV